MGIYSIFCAISYATKLTRSSRGRLTSRAVSIMRVYLWAMLAVTGQSVAAFTAVHYQRPDAVAAASSTTSLSATGLIVQNKGGGHGELGYQLAKALQQHGTITAITILQDQACKDTQEPFKSYATDLPDVTVIRAPLADESMTAADLQALLGGDDVTFDYVWDNASKAPVGAGRACVDCAKNWGVQLYTYVSSGGVYKPAAEGATFPMPETTPVKETAGQVLLENYAVEQGLPLVSFRPQYIYGEKANKHDYMYVFVNIVHVVRRRVPIFASAIDASRTSRVLFYTATRVFAC